MHTEFCTQVDWDIEEESKNVSTEEESTLATNKNVTTTHCFQKLYISFLFRLYDETKVNAEEFLDCIASSNWAMLIFAHSFQSFCIGLISFWVARSSRRDGEQWYEIGNKSKLALRKLAETSRWTFENKWYLLEADEAFCNGSFVDAKFYYYYEKAVASAKTHKVR